MKKLLLLYIFLFSIAGFAQKPASTPKPTVSKALLQTDASKPVREVFDRLVDGIKTADAEKVMSVYDKNDRILFFNNNGTVTMGWETMKSNREASYAKTKNVSLEVTGVRVELLSPTAAYITCKWKQTQEYEGKLESASGRMTLVLKKIGKDWKIVHLHSSPDSPQATRPVFPSERTPE